MRDLVAACARCAGLALLGLACRAAVVEAQTPGPYAPLGADVLLQGRPAEGLLVLHSGYANSDLVDADAVVFMGADSSGSSGDVLTVSVGLRDPSGWGRARFGRFMLATGAVRPVQIDGISLTGRAPTGSSLEVFGGLPVVPELAERDFDWLAGARAAQWLWDERFGVGVSYLHRRDAGALADEEVGTDVTATLLPWLTLSAVGAWDIVYDGLAEARATASAHDETRLVQVYASRRVASRLLAATSLFSVISDAATTELGSDASWTLYPRLDVGGTLALEGLEDDFGYRAALRSTLRLSDEGDADVRAELQRRELGDQAYSGCSLTSRVPLFRDVQANASVELVAPDHPGNRGSVWPWTRVGASYAIAEHWTLAAAVGAKATPEVSGEVYGLVRVSYFEQVSP